MSNVKSFTPLGPLNTAVLFLVFNRLETTKQVFEAIKKAKPPRLYIAADGARGNKAGEEEKVKAVRNYILDHIDWECETKTLFRDTNLGCKTAVSSAISWFFEQENQGIILEDDCLPSQSFFWYCEDLLEKYKNDERIFLISGYNQQNIWNKYDSDYFFSNLGGIWGWASWKRAWEHYDVEMKDIDAFMRQDGFQKVLGKKLGKIRQDMIYNNIILRKMNTWDYQWGYTRHKNSGLACVPVYSLIENIGFGEEATHTVGPKSDDVKYHEIEFPLKDNNFIIPDRKYDAKFFEQPRLISRAYRKVVDLLKSKHA